MHKGSMAGVQAEQFDLIFEGMREDSEGSRERLLRELNKQCVSQIFEVDSLLDGGPFLLQRSSNRQEIERYGKALQAAGAKVLIVKSRERAAPRVSPGTVIEFPANAPHVVKPDESTFRGFFQNYTKNITRILHALNISEVEALLFDILAARETRNQIFVFGNGGSASSASHMANDFSKQRFEDESTLFRILSLNDNISWMTATANDMGYDFVFVNQLKNLLQPDDLVIGISSSGNSPNISRALEYANTRGAKTWGIVGFHGGEVRKLAKKSIYIPTKAGQYGYMEDITLILNHMLSVYIYERDCARFCHDSSVTE